MIFLSHVSNLKLCEVKCCRNKIAFHILGNRTFKACWDQPSIKLTDPYGVTIHTAEFNAIVNNYRRSGSWYINVEILGEENTNDFISSDVSVYISFLRHVSPIDSYLTFVVGY